MTARNEPVVTFSSAGGAIGGGIAGVVIAAIPPETIPADLEAAIVALLVCLINTGVGLMARNRVSPVGKVIRLLNLHEVKVNVNEVQSKIKKKREEQINASKAVDELLRTDTLDD